MWSVILSPLADAIPAPANSSSPLFGVLLLIFGTVLAVVTPIIISMFRNEEKTRTEPAPPPRDQGNGGNGSSRDRERLAVMEDWRKSYADPRLREHQARLERLDDRIRNARREQERENKRADEWDRRND